MMQHLGSRPAKWAPWAVVCLFLASSSFAEPNFLTTWQARYPNSLSDDHVMGNTGLSCRLCHVATFGGNNYNAYGWEMRQAIRGGATLAAAIAAIEGLDSDLDPTGAPNLLEIESDTQPGWTVGTNTGYNGNGTPSDVPAPTDIGPLDPTPATEPDIALDPIALDFGTVTVGSGAQLSTSVRNLGSADLSVSAINRCSGSSAEFTWSPAAPLAISSGGSAVLTVSYHPGDLGLDTGCLELLSNDPDEPSIALDVTGTGIAAPEPDINLDPASLNFGTSMVGNSVLLDVAVQNLGDAPLTVTSIDLCLGTSGEFSWSSLPSFAVPVGGSHVITVSYLPGDSGPDVGCLQFTSNDPDESSLTLDVMGEGTPAPPNEPDINLVPSSLDFGDVFLGATATLVAQVQNLGDADLEVTLVDRCSGTSMEFTWSPASGFIVAPGGSASLSVSYAPTNEGVDMGCLALATNDPDENPAQLGVTGLGVMPPPNEPDLRLVPDHLDFGGVLIGDSMVLSAEVRNVGLQPLEVSLVDLCVGTTTEFTFTPDFFTVAPGTSQSLDVTYTPMDPGADGGCLAIASNDPDLPVAELALAGSGIETIVDLDIEGFRVSKQTSIGKRDRPIEIRLVVKNQGLAAGARQARVTGEHNGMVVYDETLMVTDEVGRGGSSYVFPDFSPTAEGQVLFTVEVFDDDPDVDQMTAMSKVVVR